MKTEDYLNALENLRQRNESVANGIMQLIGAMKAEMYKAKKMPGQRRVA